MIILHKVVLILQKQTVDDELQLKGEFAAVAYSSMYYVGKILERFTKEVHEDKEQKMAEEDTSDVHLMAENPSTDIRMKFLEFSKSSQTCYWPISEDITVVVFMNQLTLKPAKNKMGHFISEPSPGCIREIYLQYKEKYDMK